MSRRFTILVVLMCAGMAMAPGCGGGATSTFSIIGDATKPTEGGGGGTPAAFVQNEPGQKAGEAAKDGNPAPADVASKRHIIYTATLDIVVKDLDAATPEVEKLIAAHKGFVAKSEVKGDTSSLRSATYTVRVPAESFTTLKHGLLTLGTPERNVVDSQDVTEEFVDVEARIKNLKEQEEKLNELLKEKRKEEKLEDVIKVSDRIFVVRGDVERAQGRRNYLANRVQLSTIQLTLREIKDYKPPTAATFGSRISDTFDSSWTGLVDFGQGAFLIVVALTPWLPILIPGLIVLVWGRRWVARNANVSVSQLGKPDRLPLASHVVAQQQNPAVNPPDPNAKP